MKKYVSPEIKIIEFGAADIIQTSGGTTATLKSPDGATQLQTQNFGVVFN